MKVFITSYLKNGKLMKTAVMGETLEGAETEGQAFVRYAKGSYLETVAL